MVKVLGPKKGKRGASGEEEGEGLAQQLSGVIGGEGVMIDTSRRIIAAKSARRDRAGAHVTFLALRTAVWTLHLANGPPKGRRI